MLDRAADGLLQGEIPPPCASPLPRSVPQSAQNHHSWQGSSIGHLFPQAPPRRGREDAGLLLLPEGPGAARACALAKHNNVRVSRTGHQAQDSHLVNRGFCAAMNPCRSRHSYEAVENLTALSKALSSSARVIGLTDLPGGRERARAFNGISSHIYAALLMGPHL